MAFHLYSRGSAKGTFLLNAKLFPTDLKADIRWGFDAIWNISVLLTSTSRLEYTIDGGTTYFPLNPKQGVNTAFTADEELICNIKAGDKDLFNLRTPDATVDVFRVLVSIAPQDILLRFSPVETVTLTHDLLDGSVNQDTVANAVTLGDLIVGNASPLWDVLSIGSTDDVLTVVAGAPAWVAPPVLARSFMIGYHTDKKLKVAGNFGAPFTNKVDEVVEAEGEGKVPFAFDMRRMVVQVGLNATTTGVSTIAVRVNGVDSTVLTVTIPFGVTGTFDSGIVTESVVALDRLTIHGVAGEEGGGSEIKNSAVWIRCDNI